MSLRVVKVAVNHLQQFRKCGTNIISSLLGKKGSNLQVFQDNSHFLSYRTFFSLREQDNKDNIAYNDGFIIHLCCKMLTR